MPQEKPCFHSQSTPLLLLPHKPFPTLSSSSCFPSNRHTGLVHYYSPGFTKTRIIALLSVSAEVGGDRGQGEGEGGKSKRHLMIEKNKSLLCFFVFGCVYKHILPDSCMHELFSLLALTEKSSREQSWFSPQYRNLLSFVGFWIHHLPFIKSTEVVHSITSFKLLSVPIYHWQSISSMKMGTMLDFFFCVGSF